MTKTSTIYDRKIDIARDRGIDTDELLKYNIVHSPYLYDVKDDLPTKPKKALLITEFGGSLTPVDYSFSWKSAIDTVIDVMANVRKVPVKDISAFKKFFESHYHSLSNFLNRRRCDFVFDIYRDEPSVKDCERKRRTGAFPINLTTIDDDTPLPKDMSSFWPSGSNKCLLEKYFFLSLLKKYSSYPLVSDDVSQGDEKWT